MIMASSNVKNTDQGLQLPSKRGFSHSAASDRLPVRNHADQTTEAPSYRMNFAISRFIWEGDSAFDAWLSATSTEIAQVLLALPSTFAQVGLASGIAFLAAYGLIGCWSCYVIVALYAQYRSTKEAQNVSFRHHIIQWHEILGGLLGRWWLGVSLFFTMTYMFFKAAIQIIVTGSIAFDINNKHSKRTWTLLLGALFLFSAFIPSARNYRIWSFMGILLTTYASWYLTIASTIHGQDSSMKLHIRPHNLEDYFIGTSTIVYLFGGSHGFAVEIMHAMWMPQEYKLIYLYSTLYILSFTIPSASALYWAFGNQVLINFNAFSLLPQSKFKCSAAIAMLLHAFMTFSAATLPLNLVWEKLLGLNHSCPFLKRWLARVPIVLLLWFFAIMIPFFGPINSVVGSIFATGVGYIIPCLAHIMYFWSIPNQESAIEKPPYWLGGWKGAFFIDALVIIWVAIIGVGFGGPFSIKSIVHQVHQFGLFAKCYLC